MTRNSIAAHKSLLIRIVLIALLVCVTTVVLRAETASAACAAQPTTYGKATVTVTVPQTATYKVWSRIMAPNTTANSYTLEVDDTTCGVVVGDSAIPANTWTWVDYKTATASSKITLNLTAGQHTMTMFGREADVKLDRVILTADTACVPTGTGENCASPPDTTPPIVSVSAPADNASVYGQTTINATATDDEGISKVEFYVDGALQATDTTAGYSASFNMSSLSLGSHTIYARAYDTANNQTNSSLVLVNVVNAPDTTAPAVSVTSPTSGETLSGTASLSANATDATGVSKVEFYVDGALKATDTTSPYVASLDTKTLTNASHNFTAKAFDAANNSTTSASVAAIVNNIVSPPADTTSPAVTVTNPIAGSTVSEAIALSASATDNVGVTKVEFYVDSNLVNTDSSAPYDFSLDTKTLTNGTHTMLAKAFDAAGNTRSSTAISVTVSNVTYLAEDINMDGKVNIQDFSLLSSKFGQTGTNLGRADINKDGRVSIQDFSLLSAKFVQ